MVACWCVCDCWLRTGCVGGGEGDDGWWPGVTAWEGGRCWHDEEFEYLALVECGDDDDGSIMYPPVSGFGDDKRAYMQVNDKS